MDDAVDPADPRLGGVRPSALPLDRALSMTVAGEDAIMFRNVQPKTASGKVELASPYLDGKYGARLPSYRPVESPYPLVLITPASDQRIDLDLRRPVGAATPPRRWRCTPTTRAPAA